MVTVWFFVAMIGVADTWEVVGHWPTKQACEAYRERLEGEERNRSRYIQTRGCQWRYAP